MTRLQRWTLIAVCLATAMLMLDVAVVATALPDVAADLHADLHRLKWVIDAYALALGGVVLTAGSLADRLGRRRMFVAGLVVFTAGLAIAARRLRESCDPVPRAVDVPGQITLMLALVGIVFGLLNAADAGWQDALTLGPLLGGLAFALAFVAIELRVREPMVPLAMFAQRPFAAAQVTAISISAGLYAMLAYLMIYLQQVLGLTAIEAGLVLVPATLLNLVVAAASAPLAGRVSPRAIIVAGLGCATAGIVAMTSVDTGSSWWVVLPGLCLGNVGAGLINPAIGALTLQVPAERSGLASGIHDTARQAGMALGVAALGALIPVGSVAIDPSGFVDGVHDALWVGAAVTAAGAAVTTALLGHRRYGFFGATYTSRPSSSR